MLTDKETTELAKKFIESQKVGVNKHGVCIIKDDKKELYNLAYLLSDFAQEVLTSNKLIHHKN